MEYTTLKGLYQDTISSYGELRAMSTLGFTSITYAEFAKKVDKIVAIMSKAGINSGDKVALLSSSMPNWNVCYFAAVISGVVVVPILPDFSGVELDKIIEHSESKALFISDKLYAKISKESIGSMNVVVRTKNLKILKQKVKAKGVLTDPKPEDIASIIYTSGTTSQPKGVMLTHQNLVSQIRIIQSIFYLGTNDRVLSILPLSHAYECSVGMIFPFSSGAYITYLDKPPTASTLLPALKELRPTFMLTVPLILEKIYRQQVVAKFNKNAFSRAIYKFAPIRKLIHKIAGKKLFKVFGGEIRFLGIGGAKLNTQTERFLLEGKFPYAIGYGLSETAPLIAAALPGEVALGSTGPAIKGVSVRLENVNPQSGEGEIVAKSPSTMLGYFKNPEATNEAFTPDGWFRTKDLGFIDDKGYIYIKGRLNNMIIGASGENIYPEEVESIVNSHYMVAESLVVQRKNALVAIVNFNQEVLEQESNGTLEKLEEIKKDIIEYVNSRVSKFSQISKIEEEEEPFTKTPTLKIKRYLYN